LVRETSVPLRGGGTAATAGACRRSSLKKKPWEEISRKTASFFSGVRVPPSAFLKMRYIIAHVNDFRDERYLLKAVNKRGSYCATNIEARSGLSKNLVPFNSIEEIIKFLEGDIKTECAMHKRGLHDKPETFRLTPYDENSFNVYKLNKGLPEIKPYLTLKAKGREIIK